MKNEHIEPVINAALQTLTAKYIKTDGIKRLHVSNGGLNMKIIYFSLGSSFPKRL